MSVSTLKLLATLKSISEEQRSWGKKKDDLEICNSLTFKQTDPWLLVIWTCNFWHSSTRHAQLVDCSRLSGFNWQLAAGILQSFYRCPFMLLQAGFMATDSRKGRRAWPKGLKRKQTVNSPVAPWGGSSSATIEEKRWRKKQELMFEKWGSTKALEVLCDTLNGCEHVWWIWIWWFGWFGWF